MAGMVRHMGISLFFVALVCSLVVACGGDGGTSEPSPGGPGMPPETPEDKVITIGNLSDLTGVSANAMSYINMALDDIVEYYNDNELIPGVKLKVITYDGQMDPARDIPGYEWLRQKGADVIVSPIPSVPVTLKSRVDRDGVILFVMTANKEGYLPPGNVFNLGIDPEYDAYTMMKWIAEYDWDWEAKGPAKVGAAAWDESYSGELIRAMKRYCEAHPEQFDWQGGFLTNFSFTWGSEVEALKDCDYIYPGIVMLSFVKEYRAAGYTGAKFIGTDTQTAFFEMIDKAELWDEIDGMLFLKFSRWWNDEGELIDMIRQLMYENHADSTDSIMASGVGYLSMNQMYAMLCIIADAAETVGPQNLDSQAIYDAAISYQLNTDGVSRLSFGSEKRDAVDAYGMYEARAEEQDIFRVQEEWYPTVRQP